MADGLLLCAAFVSAVCGMACCALAMQVHWAQVRGSAVLETSTVHRLRVRGAVGLAAALALCLAADHVSMAALVWVMLSTLSAVLIAFVLAYRPRVLRVLLVFIP
jgi:hypothetical protein